MKHLRAFGEAGTVTIGKDGKVGNRGVTMMLLGPAGNHGGDTYRMWHEGTEKVTETRDVRFLGRMYFQGSSNKDLEEPMVVVERIEEPEKTDTHVSFDMDTEVWESDDVAEINSAPETSDPDVRRSGRVRTVTPR